MLTRCCHLQIIVLRFCVNKVLRPKLTKKKTVFLFVLCYRRTALLASYIIKSAVIIRTYRLDLDPICPVCIIKSAVIRTCYISIRRCVSEREIRLVNCYLLGLVWAQSRALKLIHRPNDLTASSRHQSEKPQNAQKPSSFVSSAGVKNMQTVRALRRVTKPLQWARSGSYGRSFSALPNYSPSDSEVQDQVFLSSFFHKCDWSDLKKKLWLYVILWISR